MKDLAKPGNNNRDVLTYGKIPPQSKELEEAVLGAILLERSAIDIVASLLTPDCFYTEANKQIFAAILAMFTRNTAIDMLTLINELQSNGSLESIGGAYYVARLTNAVVSTANLETHARIVFQKFLQRELIRISGEVLTDAYADTTDVFDLLDDAETSLFNVSKQTFKKSIEPIIFHATKVFERTAMLKINREAGQIVTGVPSGFKGIDRHTYGWQATDLIILAARPSVGKTAMALNLARNAAMDLIKPTKVGIFSLEMSTGQLVSRILSRECEIELDKIMHGLISDEETSLMYSRSNALLQKGIYIDDTPAINLFELRTKVRRIVSLHGVGLVIVDYLQLMSGESNKHENREREISKISAGLKALAKELNIPVIALSQLSRRIEERSGEKIPQLSDLRESGAIEQDADVVCFLYKPSEADILNDGNLRNKGFFKIAKNRNGTLNDALLGCYMDIQKWCDINEPRNSMYQVYNDKEGFVPAITEDFTMPKSEK